MKVLVCGGRDFKDYTLVKETLDKLGPGWFTVIQGGAKGADFLAKQWAYVSGCGVEEYKADWKTYGKKAGPMRNKQMLEEGKPDMVIAFPGGKGTAHMVKIAQEANIPVKEIT